MTLLQIAALLSIASALASAGGITIIAVAQRSPSIGPRSQAVRANRGATLILFALLLAAAAVGVSLA